MSATRPVLYRVCRALLQGALGFYFTRIERFHAERVPLTGPVLFTSNHPNSLTDAFVIGTSVHRKVNFVATVQLFRFRAARWLLTRCGVIAVNRVKDDPRAMRSVMDTFEACFQVLERGEAVAIFPEGLTHDDPQLKTVKTGAARMALELENRHAGKLGLQIVPVGLTFSAKETYRSTALANFGEPIRVADFLGGYAEHRRERIHDLTQEIERRIQGLMLHLGHLERERIVAAVRRLYLDRLRVGNQVIHEPVPPQTGDLLLTQAIARAVDAAYEQKPERAAEFVRRLDHYERWLKRLHLSDELLEQYPERSRMLAQSAGRTVLGLLGLPIALYGWVHRIIPYEVVQLAVKKAARGPTDKTQVTTPTVLVGLVAFTLFYGLYILVVHAIFGWPISLWYALSLPIASLTAHYYAKHVSRLLAGLRAFVVLTRAPVAARRLLAERAALLELVERQRRDIEEARAATKGAV